MEHPLIGNIDNLTVDQLQTKISELQKKINFARRTGNAHLVSQIQMAIETYQNRYQAKLQASQDSQNKDNPDHSDKINIS